MNPAIPIIPSQRLPITMFGHGQENYRVLPGYKDGEGTVLSRWHLTWRERLQLLFSGNLYLTVLTFNQMLQPVMLTLEPPPIEGITSPVKEKH